MLTEEPILVAALQANQSNGDNFQISYFLRSVDYSGDAPHTGFGIEARLYSGDKLIDEAAVNDVTCSQDEAIAMIGILSKNTVTPVTLKDVIEDYISA